MSKTAMQELIEWMQEGSGNGTKTIGNILEKSKGLLEKEKDIIIQSWKEGWKQGANFSADPELYFTSNFLSNEEKS